MNRFRDKIAVVTGGAMGFGRSTAEKLAEEGARLIVVDVDQERGEEAVAALPDGDHVYVHGDLSRRDEIAVIAEGIRGVTNVLDVLVNNAGIYIESAFDRLEDVLYDRQMAVNLHSPLWLTQAMVPLLKDRGAAVVNVSSECAWRPRPLGTAYDVSKAGLGGLTRSLAAELWGHRIRVNEVAPGGSVTEMHYLKADDPQAKKLELEREVLPMGFSVMRRPGRPAEIASAIAFLASHEASFITATTLHVDGGQGMG